MQIFKAEILFSDCCIKQTDAVFMRFMFAVKLRWDYIFICISAKIRRMCKKPF